ncbi:MAG: ribonuclease HII [Nitrospinota bacterium]
MAVGWRWEGRRWSAGRSRVAGVDEAGRGPIAGPVVAAAVILPPGCRIPGLDDSKRLKPSKRESLRQQIVERAVSWAVASETPDVIDRINILRAALRAMATAVCLLKPEPDCLLVDGSQAVPLPAHLCLDQFPIVRGDGQSVSIAAASVLAKVHRDGEMAEYDHLYPGYGFARHKGYGTRAHLEALARLGLSPIHRRSFRPVRELLSPPGPPGDPPEFSPEPESSRRSEARS